MTETMRAMVLTGHGGPDKLVWREDCPKPVPGPGEVLIRVLACGLNNTDVNTRTGWYSKAVSGPTTDDSPQDSETGDAAWGGAQIVFPRIQGADVAGQVEAVGEGVEASLVGKRVMVDTWLRDWDDPLNRDKAGYFGSECDGGFAEYTKVDHRNVHALDCDLTDAEVASFATAYGTAENMLNRVEVTADDTVLITGASGGVGSALIQLANRRGATAVAMCAPAKAEQVQAVGPAAVLPRTPEDLPGALEKAIGRREVTVVADVVGGTHWPHLIEALERGGRYVCSGAIAGPIVEFDLRTFYLRDLTLVGATVPLPGVFADVVGYIERGEIRPLVADTKPLAELHEAQRIFTAKTHTGNIVVIP